MIIQTFFWEHDMEYNDTNPIVKCKKVAFSNSLNLQFFNLHICYISVILKNLSFGSVEVSRKYASLCK